MQDDPTPAELTIAVAEFLRRDLLPSLKGHLGFQLRVSINALDLVARQLTREAAANEAESRRLVALLGHGGELPTLNRELYEAIASGHMSLSTAGLADHLWASTMEKLAVDQPTYASYRRESERDVGFDRPARENDMVGIGGKAVPETPGR